jgi:phosphatidyl-myo-inositol dimannoside synthase
MSRRRVSQQVLFVFTEVFANGGIQRFNQTILDACNGLEVQYRVLSLNDSTASIAAHQKHDSQYSITGFSGNRWHFVLAIVGALMRNRYDWVLIGHVNFLTLLAAILAPWRFRAPRTMLVAHGIEVWSGIDGVRRFALRRIDRILCVSHYTRRRILEQAPALIADRLVIFPNALAETWRGCVAIPFAQSLPERFILSVTRLEPGDRNKGIATVIEAFSMLADPSMHYFIVGQGRDRPFLELVAMRCGVQQRVHFVRGVSDSELVALYRKCRAFVLPSGKEGFGIVFLEAMFFGAPVIAASEKGAVDVVRNGSTGLSVPFGDTIAIREAIERIMSDTELRECLCTNGRSLVSEGGPFTFARFSRRCAEVFELGEPSAA